MPMATKEAAIRRAAREWRGRDQRSNSDVVQFEETLHYNGWTLIPIPDDPEEAARVLTMRAVGGHPFRGNQYTEDAVGTSTVIVDVEQRPRIKCVRMMGTEGQGPGLTISPTDTNDGVFISVGTQTRWVAWEELGALVKACDELGGQPR